MSYVIPYFIPHQGCAHQCLFCNQNTITGEEKGKLTLDRLRQNIDATITTWLDYRRDKGLTEFAFYGGSFTCLPEEIQVLMLEAVQPWLKKGEIESIRLSTRPDCIHPDICAFLRDYGVATIELGVQSLDDNVLSTALRGHSAQHSLAAAGQLKDAKFRLGIQLMPGLPGESRISFIRTVKDTIGLQPQFVRLYPALVVKPSGLEKLYDRGEFTPMSLERAIVLTSWARRRFLQSGIEVVRMGLQPSESLEKSIVAGPYHPAFGELVISREWYRRVKKLFKTYPEKKITITLSDKDLSSFKGIKKENMVKFARLGFTDRLQVKVNKNMERGMMHHAVS